MVFWKVPLRWELALRRVRVGEDVKGERKEKKETGG